MIATQTPATQKTRRNVSQVEFRIADSRELREEAFRLVYSAYVESGLMSPNQFGMRVTPYHLLPTTTVFVAILDQKVISTMTLVEDGRLGLPLQSVYQDLVPERRRQGKFVGEVSCLADRRSDPRRFFEVFCQLARLMAQYARRHGVDQLLAITHPKHGRFYQRYLCFEPVGGLTACPHVEGKPAVAQCLDFAKADAERPKVWDQFFGAPLPEYTLQRPQLSRQEFEFLCQVAGVRRPAPAPHVPLESTNEAPVACGAV